MASYDVILFDADDTLLDFAKSEAVSLEVTLTEFGYTEPFESYHDRFKEINRGVWREYEHGLLSSDEIRVKRFDLLMNEFGRKATPDEISEFYVGRLQSAGFMMPGARDLLTDLYGTIPLGLVTNGIGVVQRSRLAKTGLTDFFDAIVISEEVGIQKPDPQVFRLALETLGAASDDRVIMIGDGLASDIKGAIAAGIDSCWVNVRGSKPSEDIHPTFEVDRLPDVRSILGM